MSIVSAFYALEYEFELIYGGSNLYRSKGATLMAIDWSNMPVQFDHKAAVIIEIENPEEDLNLDLFFSDPPSQGYAWRNLLEGAANNNIGGRHLYMNGPQAELREAMKTWRNWPVRIVEAVARNPRPALSQDELIAAYERQHGKSGVEYILSSV